MTVTNDEVSQAMRAVWNSIRVVPEPSGAMGLAALMQDWDNGRIRPGEKCLVVLSGANMDFSQLGVVESRGRAGEQQETALPASANAHRTRSDS